MSKWMTAHIICYVLLYCMKGSYLWVPSHTFFPGQNKPCPKMLQRSGGCLKHLKCSTVSQIASSFQTSGNRSTVFSVSVLPTVSSRSLWGRGQESFSPLRPCLNWLGRPTESACWGAPQGLPSLALTPLFMKQIQSPSRCLDLEAPEIENETSCLLPFLVAACSSILLHRWLAVQKAWMKQHSSPPSSDWNYHFQFSQRQDFWEPWA